MYLSQWKMSYEEYAQNFQGDFHKVHQKVWCLFGDKDKDRKFLYRELMKKEGVVILVQSEYPVEEPPTTGTFLSKEFNRPLKKGKTYQFNIKTNPVVEKARPGKKNSAKVPLTDPRTIEEWLIKRLEGRGVQVKSVQAQPCLKRFSSSKGYGISTCEVKGVLILTDEEIATTLITKGIGDSKSYGCGLLLLTEIEEESINSDVDCDD